MASFLDSRRSAGAGVSKNEPEKKGAEKYFQLLFRKFWSYVKLNLLYILVSLPTIIFYTTILLYLLYGLLNEGNAIAILFQSIAISLLLVTFFSGSPCSAGYYYVLRNYVREEHAWVASDFFEHTRLNFGKALAAYLIDVCFVTISLINISIYPTLFDVMGFNAYTIIIAAAFGLMVIFYAMMHTFMWTLMVTFDLKFTQIYRNSFLLSMISLPRNLGGLILRAAIAILAFIFIPIPLLILLSIIILTAAFGLSAQMYAYPTIKKIMLDKIAPPEEEYSEEDDDEFDLGYVPNGPNDIAGLFKKTNKEDDNEPV